jgi:hypothetical protein
VGNEEEKTNQESKTEDAPKEEKSLVKAEGNTPQKTNDKDGIIPDDVIDFEQMPPEVRKSFQAFMAMSTRYSGPRPNPLIEKFTEAHVDKYLDYAQRDEDNEYHLRKTNRWFYLLYAVLVLAIFIAAVVYLLPRDKELLEQLIDLIVILGGGIGAGYGLSKRGK